MLFYLSNVAYLCKLSYLTSYIYKYFSRLDHILKLLLSVTSPHSSGCMCMLWPCRLVTRPPGPDITITHRRNIRRLETSWHLLTSPGSHGMVLSLTTIASSVIDQSRPWFIQVLSASSSGGSRGSPRPQAPGVRALHSILAAHATFSLSTGSSSQQQSPGNTFQHFQKLKRRQASGISSIVCIVGGTKRVIQI